MRVARAAIREGADAAGRATWKGTIPATLEPGKHTLTFQGSVDRGVVIDVAEAEKIVGCELSTVLVSLRAPHAPLTGRLFVSPL